jgi:hypothetical protein
MGHDTSNYIYIYIICSRVQLEVIISYMVLLLLL